MYNNYNIGNDTKTKAKDWLSQTVTKWTSHYLLSKGSNQVLNQAWLK